MLLHTVDLVGLRNRATKGRKYHGEFISAITGRETTRKIETTCKGKPAKLQYRTLKSGQRVSYVDLT